MGRAILSLAGLEIGGGWLLVSPLGFTPILAYCVMACVGAALVAVFILRASRSRPD